MKESVEKVCGDQLIEAIEREGFKLARKKYTGESSCRFGWRKIMRRLSGHYFS